jgi:hypothetical protein
MWGMDEGATEEDDEIANEFLAGQLDECLQNIGTGISPFYFPFSLII